MHDFTSHVNPGRKPARNDWLVGCLRERRRIRDRGESSDQESERRPMIDIDKENESELRIVDFDVIGMSRLEEAMNGVDWHLHRLGGGVERVSMDGTMEETISAWMYQYQKPLTIPFLDHQEKRLNRKITALTEDGIRSLCALPLICAHQRIGCLLIGSKQPEAYSNDEVRFLSLIADMIASALAGAINFEALQKTQADLQVDKDRLQLLLELNNHAVS